MSLLETDAKQAVWTPDKLDRFKKMVLRHIANGGTVKAACEQFEVETGGVHKARMNQLKWYMTLRSECREEFRRAQELGTKSKFLKLQQKQSEESEEPVDMDTIKEDELANRLFSALEDLVEDRRQIGADLVDFKERVDYYERQVHTLEDEKKLAELRHDKKEREFQKVQQELADKQFKYDQLAEDYNQLRQTDAREFERIQQQLREMQLKYENLNNDYSRFRGSSQKEIQQLEEQVREEQIRYSQLFSQYDAIRQENVALMKRITDFAQQITAFAPSEQVSPPPIAAVPIRPSLSKEPSTPAVDASKMSSGN